MHAYFKSILLHVILLISLLSISGCRIDGEESLELNSDGSATISLNYAFPNKAFSKKECEAIILFLQEVAERHEEVTVIQGDVLPSGFSARRLIIELEIDSVTELESIFKEEIKGSKFDPDSGNTIAEKLYAIIGKISADFKGTSIQYRREINLNSLLKSQVRDPNVLGEFEFRYSLTVPDAPSSHNATSTSNNGRTLTWVLPLKEHYDKPFIMEATIPAMAFLPWWVWAIAVAIALLILGTLFFVLRKVFRKRA